ncbi:MAG: hypothetical protein A3I88_01905 [Candidatus Portnoybacteria bacterium RIFCSPLOWO2_12_FULL_39_9]|uniref:Peptidase M15B domain-containing protein n=1 Tax=Candidatus Portnoybacteria bacterium RIFCSPHIGHO2_12_FULL_38_9 TaxID=1801997 RepID=A0A1G2FHB8_9BACT|nr:MAG: hypothetical protein A3H00_01185 [Candidatus Portnoybacteria bacterium RBG_13_40_8]OGZ36569.1 MAG: hypothetical protein A2646_00085 [Candidatus Portnoybacteria bacterium RIFCSPHIGHO2_02_FULL_39_12]OGZ37463.1 MAG: hypothetical protein A3J64_00510 [Candidatus Portnoybacteria bacterium RIFCSPHIGHO2_12_FULL_38_9]OGZ39109.1 MAG: hypothetical protein A3F21_00085 [Candidatus Portnoybacteria bacterium RIFCSPLOWO2_01_FULL_38_39]OGZ40199.1 MAG: hypothetical protein A3I88_01905 [Candidatus Portnoy
MKKFSIFVIIIFALLSAYSVSAAYQLETTYPEIEGVKATSELTSFIRYIYIYGLATIGLVALGALVIGGIMYMGAGSITSAEEAKKIIWGAIGGLLLGLGAYLILNTINPDLLKLKKPEVKSFSLRKEEEAAYRTASEQSARSQLSQAGINTKRECQPNESTGCVTFDGIRENTLNEVIGLKRDCGCDIYVSGARESGHRAGSRSHQTGHKIDIHLNDPLNNYISENFKRVGTRPSDQAPLYENPQTGNLYAKESDHWDIFVR